MALPLTPVFCEVNKEQLAETGARIAVFVTPEGQLDAAARSVNSLTRGAIKRMVDSGAMAEMKPGEIKSLNWPMRPNCEAVDVVCLPSRPTVEELRKAGAALGALFGKAGIVVVSGRIRNADELVQSLMLRAYSFDARKTGDPAARGDLVVMVNDPAAHTETAARLSAVAEGVFFTRDLVNEPANVLTTTEFAERLLALKKLGVKVSVLDEPAMEKLGMGALLCVGQGSVSPSKIVVMEWQGGKKGAAPLALVGKGVVFDTGGISLKPAAGMEDMTMDMGGAGVVAGTMRTLAQRKAKANVVGVVGLVENMPSGNATRPGDVVTSMKGDTIEVINTDAEGRLVLADVLWYTQETFKPAGVIDLATLTGAIIIGLGHDNAGVFSNDDRLCDNFLKAARTTGEGAWRMPIDASYASKLKSRIADVKNVGGRPAGAITAAKFLERFIQEDMPWIHLDIAGVASVAEGTLLAPKGATGWGVRALNQLVADQFETD